MAIDTRDKRLSVLGYGLSIGSPLPTPDTTVAAAERRSLSELYSGVINVDWTIRSSMLNLNLAWLRPFEFPEGFISSRDRQQIAGLYHELSPTAPGGTLIVFSHTIGRALQRGLGRSL